MSDAGSSRPLVERLFGGGGPRRPAEPGRPFVGTGIAALAEVARAAGARLVVGTRWRESRRSPVRSMAVSRPPSAWRWAASVWRSFSVKPSSRRAPRSPAKRSSGAFRCASASRRRSLVGARRAAEAGMAVLVPGTVGEAVDHACAAILAAESALVPVVVALDGPTLAFAVQAAGLPSVALLGRLLGRPADSVHSDSVAERELFGEHRRRIPRWHDATRAIRLGGELGPQAGRAACAAERIFFTRDLARHLDSALARVGESTGRPLPAVAGAKLGRADLGLVATGAFAETARALAATLGRSAPRLGVLALRRSGTVAGVRARGARGRLPQTGGDRAHRTCRRRRRAHGHAARRALRSRRRARHARRCRGGGVARRWRPRRRLPRAGRALSAAASAPG